MGKPLGISLSMVGGLPRMRATQSDLVTDEIWDAVESARNAGWDIRQFINEAKQAWSESCIQESKDVFKD